MTPSSPLSPLLSCPVLSSPLLSSSPHTSGSLAAALCVIHSHHGQLCPSGLCINRTRVCVCVCVCVCVFACACERDSETQNLLLGYFGWIMSLLNFALILEVPWTSCASAAVPHSTDGPGQIRTNVGQQTLSHSSSRQWLPMIDTSLFHSCFIWAYFGPSVNSY